MSTPPSPRRRTAAAALALLLALAVPSSFAAATATKKGGQWSETDTWTNGVPGGLDFATISAGDAVSISMPGAGAYVIYNNGIIDLQADAPPSLLAGTLGVGLQLNVGYARAGELRVSGGARLGSVDTIIGALGGSNGFVKIDGAPNRKGDRASWVNTGELSIGASGFGIAEGRVILIDLGTITSTNVAIGSGESKGYADINNAVWTNGNLLKVGDGGPLGVLSIGNGGEVNGRTGVIGYGSGSTASATDSLGRAFVDNARWINTGDLTVGAYARAELTVSGGGLVQNQAGTIGLASSASGTATVTGATWTNTGLLTIGKDGSGTLHIERGGRVDSTGAVVGRGGNANGTVVVDDARWVNGGELVVGHGITGLPGSRAMAALTVRDGGRVDNGNASIGLGAGSNGTVDVHGLNAAGAAATWTSSADLVIGYSGTGLLTVSDGGRVVSPRTYLGYNAAGGGNGRLELNGSGSRRGVLETAQVLGGTGAGPLGGVLVFDGGVLRASQHQPQLLRNLGIVTVNAGGAVIDSQGYSVATDATLSGPGGLSKQGAGTLDLQGLGFLGGLSTVDAGRLLVNGTLNGDVEVRAGALLGGSGLVKGAVTVLPGGVLSPGNSPGTLATGRLAMLPGSTLVIEIGASSDRLVVDGNLSLAGTIDFVGDAGFFSAGALPGFLSYSGTLINQGIVIGLLPAGVDRQAFRLDFGTPGAVGLAAAVPEPGAWALMAAGLAALGLRGRRRPSLTAPAAG